MIIKEFEPVKYSDFERQKIPAKNNFIQTCLSKNLMEALRLHQIGQHFFFWKFLSFGFFSKEMR
jgi:hypothetical protein